MPIDFRSVILILFDTKKVYSWRDYINLFDELIEKIFQWVNTRKKKKTKLSNLKLMMNIIIQINE